MQIGNECEGNRHGQQMGIRLGVRDAAEPFFKQGSYGGFPDPAQGQAAQGDAQLYGRQKNLRYSPAGGAQRARRDGGER